MRNLRVVSRIDNIHNANVRCDNKIGIRGITLDEYGTYHVGFFYNKRRFNIKGFRSIEEAVYCRYLFEKKFGIEVLERNPLFQKYKLSNPVKIEEIENYVDSIL